MKIELFITICIGLCATWASEEAVESGDRLPLEKPAWFGKDSFHVQPQGQEWGSSYSDLSIRLAPDGYGYVLEGRWDGSYPFVLKWEPAVNVNVVATAIVRPIPEKGLFEYRYLLTNASDSRQTVSEFIVAYTAPVAAATSPNDRWWSKALPEDVWKSRYWAWSEVTLHPTGVAPGQESDGFSIRSPGLPAVVSCFARGNAQGLVIVSPRLQSPDEVEPPDALTDPLPLSMLEDCVSGVTVGPGPDPSREEIQAPPRLASMREWVEVCVQQNWLAEPELGATFTALLIEAQIALAEDKPKAAAAALRRLAEETERLYARERPPITSEAYALLHYNAEWLISRLEQAPAPATTAPSKDPA